MFNPVKIAPSVLSADFMDFRRDIQRIERGGAGYVHFDVMDGHFVPNLTIGIPVLKQLAMATSLPVDAHLMVANPLRQIPWFVDADASLITFHAEACADGAEMRRAVDAIHEGGVRAGIALKPKTPVSVLEDVLPMVDMVLVMSVEPGFSGQSYIEGTEDKIAEVALRAKDAGVAPLLQVDGGIGIDTAARVAAAGADVLVCGNAVFKADDIEGAIEGIVAVAEDARSAALSGQK